MFRWPAYFRMFRSHISGLHWAFEQSGQTGPWFCPPPFQIGNHFCDVVQQDLATQVFYWDHYKSLCRKMSLERGRCLRPEVGEYLAGRMHAQMVIFGYHCYCQFVQSDQCVANLFRSVRCRGLPKGWSKPVYGSVCPLQFQDLFGAEAPSVFKLASGMV